MKEDPAGTYGKFLSEIRNMDSLSTEELAISINRWQSLKDSVFFYATQNTSGNPHSDLYGKCNEVHDSLHTEFTRLAGSAPRSYQDVFVLKERTSPYCDDKELADAADSIRPFFVSLDSIPPLAIDGNGIRSAYRRLLAGTLQGGIHNLTDLKTFIRDEDVMFRTFLAHLDGQTEEDVSDLTKDTERCCSLVFLAAEKKEISYRDAMGAGIRICVHDTAALHLDGRHLYGLAFRIRKREVAPHCGTDACGFYPAGRCSAVGQ